MRVRKGMMAALIILSAAFLTGGDCRVSFAGVPRVYDVVVYDPFYYDYYYYDPYCCW